ncbi:MAG: hypothetical protein IKU94_00820 [Bacteroidaceae bacterium]|nr:hypothetical protein [Bacteroidaceae bacterium]MBR4930422.1 hypothetical protein [Bacteroidaceae bacterium]
MNEIRILGNLFGHGGGSYAGTVLSVGGVSTCIKTPSGGGNQPHIVVRCKG